MAVFTLDLVLLWLTGVRSHLERFGQFRPVPATPAPGPVGVLRVVAITATVFAIVSAAV